MFFIKLPRRQPIIKIKIPLQLGNNFSPLMMSQQQDGLPIPIEDDLLILPNLWDVSFDLLLLYTYSLATYIYTK